MNDLSNRIGLIIPSSNRLTEVQFQRYLPPEFPVHVTRLRMTGPWHRPLSELKDAIEDAAKLLSDSKPGLIVFHCTASSMEEGIAGEQLVVSWIEEAAGCPALTTGQAITEALKYLRVKKIVLLSPYVKKTNERESFYLREAGFQVVHEMGLGLRGGDEYIQVTPEQWKKVALENVREEAEGYLLSCTNTTMIEAIESLERELQKPVVTSNQATLWASLRKFGSNPSLKTLGQLFIRP